MALFSAAPNAGDVGEFLTAAYILKRGINGVYHHVSPAHLKRYVGEFDFRYNSRDISDFERANRALQGIGGKRLTYR